MAEWKIAKLDIPPTLQEGLDLTAEGLDLVVKFLRFAKIAAEVLVTVTAEGFNLYKTLVSEFLDLLEGSIKDIKNAGVYVLVDYPQNINMATFNPAAESNLAGTVVDPRAIGALTSAEDADAESGLTRQNKLQAVAASRRSWNASSRDMLSYPEAIERILSAFEDAEDTLRPRFSDAAGTAGVIFMVHSEEVATFMRLVRSISNLLAINDLEQIQIPAFEELFAEIEKGFSDLTQDEIEGLNLVPDFSLRNGGRHPNFVLRAKLGKIIPLVGNIVDVLVEIIETLRPNGDVTELIEETLEAINKKIERLNEIVEILGDITDALRSGFSGSATSMVFITSTTGNSGFKEALRSSKGHPEFDRALVCTVLIYGGGPWLSVGKQFFGGVSDRVTSAVEKAVENIDTHLDRPVLTP